MGVGNFIAVKRREVKLTQTELARRVGVSRVTMNRIETDLLSRALKLELAIKIGDVIGVSLMEMASHIKKDLGVQSAMCVCELPTVLEIKGIKQFASLGYYYCECGKVMK